MAGSGRQKKTTNEIVELSFEFAVNMVKTTRRLPRDSEVFTLRRQLIRAGTSIGANVEEAQGSRTRREFTNSMNIAKREARETRYWLRVLKAADVLTSNIADRLLEDVERLLRILTAIVKSADGH